MPHLRVALVGLLLLVLAVGAAYFFLRQPSNPPPLQPSKPSEAKPQIAVAHTNAAPVTNTAPKAPAKMWYDLADPTSAVYKVYHHKGPVITNSFAVKMQSLSARTFKCSSDKIIGQLLSVKPGAFLFGNVKYDERFTHHRLKVLQSQGVKEITE